MKNIFKNTWTILTPKERKRFSTLIVLDILISVIDILSLVLLLWIIQFYIDPGNSNISYLPGWLTNNNSILVIGIFFVLFGIKNMAGFLIAKAQYKFIGGVAVRISESNLRSYQQSGFEEFINTDSSVHIRKIGFQPFEFCQYIISGIQQIITQTFLILLAIVAIIFFNAKLFLLLLCILLPPVVIVFYFIKKHLTYAKSQIQVNNEKSFQYLLDALKGFVESNIYNRNEFFMKRFIHSREKFSKYLFSSLSLQTMPGRMIEVFAVLGLFILIAVAKWTGNSDSASLITIGAFMAAAYKIIPGMVKVINTSGQIRAYEFALNDLIQNKDQELSTVKATSVDINSIEFQNISFQYEDLPVIKDFSFSVNKGDFVGITGRSGKGKTTIFNLLLGFLTPANGRIIINGTQAKMNDLKRYWSSIAYVRQQVFLIHDTILKNITLQENGHNHEKLIAALKISGLDELNESYGVEKFITENGKNISGGQQQRIAIARAIYKDADLILLDEPFNELDEASEILFLQYFRELSKNGRIVMMITHDKKSLSYCNKVISLDEQ